MSVVWYFEQRLAHCTTDGLAPVPLEYIRDYVLPALRARLPNEHDYAFVIEWLQKYEACESYSEIHKVVGEFLQRLVDARGFAHTIETAGLREVIASYLSTLKPSGTDSEP